MKTQIFKKHVPFELLQTLFNNVTQLKANNSNINTLDISNNSPIDISNNSNFHYKINKIVFKKLHYNNLLKQFLKSIEEFYYDSKKFYVTREIDYTKFLTLIRQICKINNIKYDKKILYLKNYYDIVYYIYI